MSERHSKVVAGKLCGGAARRSVLRALSDHADEKDNSVSLSVPDLAREAEVSDRTVQTHLKAFVKEGLIVRTGEREVLRGKVAVYTLVGAAIRALPDVRPAITAPVQSDHPSNSVTGEIAAPVKAPGKPAKVRAAGEPPPDLTGETAAPVKGKSVSTYRPSTTEREIPYSDSREVVVARAEQLALPAVEAKPKRRRRSNEGAYIDPDWQLDDADAEYAADRGFVNGNAAALAQNFKNHWLTTAGQKARKRDWHAAWHLWVDNEIKWKGAPQDEHSPIDRPRPASANRGRPRSVETEILMRGLADDPPLSDGRLDFSASK